MFSFSEIEEQYFYIRFSFHNENSSKLEWCCFRQSARRWLNVITFCKASGYLLSQTASLLGRVNNLPTILIQFFPNEDSNPIFTITLAQQSIKSSDRQLQITSYFSHLYWWMWRTHMLWKKVCKPTSKWKWGNENLHLETMALHGRLMSPTGKQNSSPMNECRKW